MKLTGIFNPNDHFMLQQVIDKTGEEGWIARKKALKDYISFYASKAEKCIVNGEIVKKQEGEFYGGWITKNLTGPFKGAKGTSFW